MKIETFVDSENSIVTSNGTIFLDWNQLSLDQMCFYLENKYKYLSSGDAFCIGKLIDFYREHKEK